MTGQYATLLIMAFIYKVKIIDFLNIKVKSPRYEYKILIYHVVFLELFLSGTNKQPGVNSIHCYATGNGCNREDRGWE